MTTRITRKSERLVQSETLKRREAALIRHLIREPNDEQARSALLDVREALGIAVDRALTAGWWTF